MFFWTVLGMSWKVLRRMQHENQRYRKRIAFFCESAKLLGLLVDLIGIEPMTSSMPWKRAPKLRHRPTCGGIQLFYSPRPEGFFRQCASLRGSRRAARDRLRDLRHYFTFSGDNLSHGIYLLNYRAGGGTLDDQRVCRFLPCR